jgi:DNA mismatch endonuclease (patch repair protein)
MADIVSEEQRSYNMSRIRSKNTKPELQVRSMLHRLGYGFTMNALRDVFVQERFGSVNLSFSIITLDMVCFCEELAI